MGWWRCKHYLSNNKSKPKKFIKIYEETKEEYFPFFDCKLKYIESINSFLSFGGLYKRYNKKYSNKILIFNMNNNNKQKLKWKDYDHKLPFNRDPSQFSVVLGFNNLHSPFPFCHTINRLSGCGKECLHHNMLPQITVVHRSMGRVYVSCAA